MIDILLTLLDDPVVIKSPVGGEIDTLTIAARTNSNPQHQAGISYNNFMASDMSQNDLRWTMILINVYALLIFLSRIFL